MVLSLVQIGFWFIAGAVSFYFSVGNARVWTSISLGFFLILFREVLSLSMVFLPGMATPELQALTYILGTIAVIIMTHGFLEYYVFSRTLELEGKKVFVFLGVALVILGSVIFVSINPSPTARTLEIIHIIENANWVFLSIINIEMLRRIYLNVKETPISQAFLAFIVVFVAIFLWKGSTLYIQVYDLQVLSAEYPFRYELSASFAEVGNLLASFSVGATFIFLLRLLR
jgi:hypothetical protein